MRQIQIYKTRKGKLPFRDWLLKLNRKIKAEIDIRLNRFSLNKQGDYKRVAKGIFELRIHIGPGYRIYFTEHKRHIIVLLIGGDKSSQKRDIKKAKIFYQDYREQVNDKK